MKILYISPENTVGILNAWKHIHIKKGNEARFITFYKSRNMYDEDICLNLPLISTNNSYLELRKFFFKVYKKRNYDDELNGYPPIYRSSGYFENLLYAMRDQLWSGIIDEAIDKYNLYDFDIYHFEWGLDFFRDFRFAKEIKRRGKKLVCHYHGQDIRTRGIFKDIDKISNLNLTNEIDLLDMHPNINHIFLPFNTNTSINNSVNDIVRICHSPTNRAYKGTNDIINIISKISYDMKIEFVLIEGVDHMKAKKLKGECDIFIDQISDVGGWGYGMSTIEAMSFGLCCICKIQSKVKKLNPDLPIISADKSTLEYELRALISNRKKIIKYGHDARSWVIKKHSYQAVGNQLYDFYGRL